MLFAAFAFVLVSLVHHAIAVQRLSAAAYHGSRFGISTLSDTGAISAEVALREEECFYIGESDNNPLVELSARSNGSDTRVLSTERFAGVIQDMTCGAGQVQVQFASQTIFDAVQAAWSWVNQKPSRLIILITGGPHCETAPSSDASEQGEDRAYAVTKVAFDPSSLSATLLGSPAGLGQLLGKNWKLRGSSRGLLEKSLRSRDVDEIDINKQIHIPNLFNHKVAGPMNVSLDGTLKSQGTLHWDMDISAWDLGSSYLHMSTTDVSFTLTPELSLSGSVDVIPPVSVNLPEIPLYGGKAGSVDLGVFLIVGAQASLGKVSAEIDASVDIQLALSDGKAVITADGSDPSVTGFRPTFSVHSPEIKGQVDLVSTIGPTVALVMQVSVLGFGLEGGIQLEAPEAQMTLAAKADSAGVCDTDHSAGVEMEIAVGAALNAIYAVGLLDDSTSSLKIYSTSTPVFSTCTAFGPEVGTMSPTASNSPTTLKTVASATESALASTTLSCPSGSPSNAFQVLCQAESTPPPSESQINGMISKILRVTSVLPLPSSTTA